MKKKSIFVTLMLILSFTIFGESIKVVVPAGLPSISIAKMKKENQEIAGKQVEYEIQKNNDALVMSMLKQEGDIAIVPSNFAAQLYNKGLGYKILGTVGWGSFYIASRDKLNSIDELKNKNIYTFGKGLTPDIVLTTILEMNKLNVPKDVKVDYVNNGNELASLFLARKVDIASIPEPMLSSMMQKDKQVKINFNLNDIWKNATGSKWGYPQSTLVVKEELLKNNSLFVKDFINKLEKSIDFLYGKDNNKAQYIEELNIIINTNILEEIILKSNLDFVNIGECKEDYEIYFKILEKNNKKVIGGQLPDEKIFADIN